MKCLSLQCDFPGAILSTSSKYKCKGTFDFCVSKSGLLRELKKYIIKRYWNCFKTNIKPLIFQSSVK